MASIWDLLVNLGINTKPFEQGTDKAKEKAHSAGTSIVNSLSMVGGAVVMGSLAAAGAAIAATGAFMASTIAPARDLNETINKSSVVFGAYGHVMEVWSQNSATALGMSQNSALGAAATYGNLFRAMGLGELPSKNMSQSLVQLAADLASFNNMDPAMVLDKLRAGLSGEVEPLRTLGVNLNQELITEKAVTLGLMKKNGTMTAAIKAQASYALIMEQTTLAQGDFARTSSGLANQQRILAASVENVKARIGQGLLPVVENISQRINKLLSDPAFLKWIDGLIANISKFADQVLDAIPKIIEWFQKIPAWFQANQGIVIGILAALGTAVLVFVYTTVIPALISLAVAFGPALIVMALVGAAAYLLYQAWTTNFMGIRDTLTAFWNNTVLPIFSLVKTWLSINIPIALAWLSTVWTTVLLPAIQSVWTWIQTVLFPMFVTAYDWLNVAIPKAIDWLSTAWTTVLWPAMKDVWNWMTTSLFPFFEKLFNNLDTTWRTVVERTTKLWQETLLPAFKDVWTFLNDHVFPIFEDIGDYLDKTLPPIISTISGWLDKYITASFNNLLQVVNFVIGAVQSLIDLINKIPPVPTGSGSVSNNGMNVIPAVQSVGGIPRPKAFGGPVSAGQAYTVGERGIETFVPKVNGAIIPHGQGGVNIYVSPHYYRGDEPSLTQELSMLTSML